MLIEFSYENFGNLSQNVKKNYGIQKQPPEVFCKKKAFLNISQILQENTFVGVSFQ